MNFTSLSDFFEINVEIKVFTQTDFPDPVCPAISKCGILTISMNLSLPTISFPNITFNSPVSSSLFFIIFEKCTGSFILFGVSIPIVFFPGIGASIRMLSAARFIAISSESPVTLLTFTPFGIIISYLVIVGPYS